MPFEEIRDSTICGTIYLPSVCSAETHSGGAARLSSSFTCADSNSCTAIAKLKYEVCKTGTDPNSVHDSDIKCVDSGDMKVNRGCVSPSPEKRYYPEACPSRVFPIGVDCASSGSIYMEIPDPTYKTCTELSVREGDPCRSGIDRCIFIPACARKDNPTQAVLAANFMFCQPFPPDPNANCPISTASAKEGIRYLGQSDRDKIAREILALKLANYEYRPGYPNAGEPNIGFIIEDSPNASFVYKKDNRVNLYSYITALVVVVQQQQEKIEALEKEVSRLNKVTPSSK